jgi:RimJ/RimL family protein N-acetyltransferase
VGLDHENAPILTERLAIGRLDASDAEVLFRYRSDPEVGRYQAWEPKSVGEVQAFILDQATVELATPGRWTQLGLYDRESGRLCGDLGVHVLERDPRQVEIGITLARECQGRGLATEALRAILEYLFVTLGKHRVIASADPRNGPCLALLERLGMRREAHHVESLWFKGQWADDLVFAMLRREWPPEGRR